MIQQNTQQKKVGLVSADKANRAAKGYRLWGIEESSGRLLSLGAGENEWKPGWNKSVCLLDEKHQAPVSDCECGFYAYYSIESPKEEYALLDSAGLIFGTVAAAGKLEIHPQGFRAEYLKIVALGSAEEEKRELLKASKSWQVPVFASEKDLFDYSRKLELIDLSEFNSKN